MEPRHLLICVMIGRMAGYPLIGKPQAPTYTSQTIQDVYEENVIALQMEPSAVYKLIEMLVQIALQQQSRLDLLEQGQISFHTDLAGLSVDLMNVKKFMFEQMTPKDPYNSRHIAKSANIPWDVSHFKKDGNLFPRSEYSQTLNDTITALSLKVDSLNHHLEKVERVVFEVKEATSDEFSGIINNILPELERRVEEKYRNLLANHFDPVPDFMMSDGDAGNHQNNGSMNDNINRCTPTILSATTTATTKHEDGEEGLIYDIRKVSNSTDVKLVHHTRQQISQMLYRDKCSVSSITRVKDSFTVLERSGKRNKVIGAWMQDGYSKSSKVYMVQGYRKLTTLIEFLNILEFTKGIVSKVHDLPFFCGGTGHIVYNNSFLCHGFKSNKLYLYNLVTKEAKETRLPGLEVHGVYEFLIGGFNAVDILADEGGVWVVSSNRESAGEIIISRLNPVTMTIEFSERTTTNITDVMNCFMTCGHLFAIYEKGEEIRVKKIWSFHEENIFDSPENSVLFDKNQQVLMMADFNPRDHRLYTWNLMKLGQAALKWYEFSFN